MKFGTLVMATSGIALVLGMGCQRSSKYRQDQDFTRQDSEYYNKKGSTTSRADRFGQPKKKLYVLPFLNATPLGGPEFGEFAADELLRELRSGNKAVVPENLKVNDVSGDFYSGDKVRLGALVREGKKLGIALVVIGKIKKITYRTKGDEVGLFRQKKAIAAVDMEMRIFDIINSKEVLFDEKSTDSSTSHINIFSDADADPKSQRAELRAHGAAFRG